MVSAVAAGAVLMAPAAVARKLVVDRTQQVVVAARAGLDDRESRGRVRHPDVQQAVTTAASGEELLRVACQVVHHGG
ncbi:hypothetical protein GCM10025762_40140 [Haloechinothrix salitolerans]